MSAPASSLLIFVGTYTKDSTSRGIYALRLDPVTGAFSTPELAAETRNPTFLDMHPNGRVLYALGEASLADGRTGGAALAFNFDAATSQLTPLNTEPTGGVSGAHLAVDQSGRTLIFVSYHGGSITAFPLDPAGRIGPRSGSAVHTGQLGPHTARQDKPHPHSVTISADGRFAYVCDLGLDKIICYRLSTAASTLTANSETDAAPGAGPRHAKFSADGRCFYVINELNGTITTYAASSASGVITARQTVSTLPVGFTGENTCAEIRLSPDGRYVYGTNRGHDSIAVFSRNRTDGTLSLVEIVPCGGKHPRNFALTPDGRWLVCAGKDSDNLVSFRIDALTGRLTPSGHAASVPAPVCVLFAPVS